MKPHTSNFKNAIKEMGRELRGVITYGNTTLEEEIMSITPHYEANLLKSVMKQLDLELSVDIPLETVINCQIGILVNGNYEMLNFGNYVVYSSEKQEDTNTYKIVCYDKILYSMKQNEDLGVTYPISIKNYLTALATKIGLTVASGTFYNQDLQIPSELYVGLDYTYRDILDEIAQATGSIITLNSNDEIEVRYPNDLGSTATVNGTNITIAEHTGNRIINTTISGNSIQDGTPTPSSPALIKSAGDVKNLYFLPEEGSSNGINYTKNDDGTINLVGTATANVNFQIFKNTTQSHIEDGATYTFSSNQALPSGVEFRVEAFNGTSWLRHLIGSVLNNYYQVFTGTANLANATRIRHLIYITSGTTVNLTNLEIQFEKGSVKTSFTPEGKGFINEVISNKNRLPAINGSYTSYELTTDWEGNTAIINGTCTQTWSGFMGSSLIPIYLTADEYTISASDYTYNYTFRFQLKDGTIKNTNIVGRSSTIEFTQDVVAYKCWIYRSDLSSVTFSNYKVSFQIEKGSSATSFVPHQEQNISIPCQQPMRSIGNARDEFIKQDGLWYEKHNIGVIESYNGETITTNYMSTTGELSTGAFVQYVLGTPNYIQCTNEQIQVLNAISHSSLYTGTTNINSDAYLSITYNLASETIDEEYLKDVNIGFAEMYGPVNSIVLSRAGESDNVYIRDEESVQEDGLCEVKIVDNQIMNFNNRSDYLQGLLTALDGLYYYINDFNSTGILYYEVGDLYNIQVGNNTYQCLMLNDEINITTGIEERIYTDLPEQSQTDYSKADKTDRRINQTYLIVDKQNQTIESVVNNVTKQNKKISQITQTVDELNSKIQDIADITTYGESQIAVVNLPEINESEPIMLNVRPITENISRLYPKGNLYPSSTQYLNTRIVNFKRTYTEEGVTKTEDIPYELPDDLLYYDSNYYDEFYLDYDSQTCQITKRCEWAGGVNNIINPADIINYSDIGGISSITYDETETFKVIFDNEDGGNIRVSRTYFKFQSDSITISLQNLVDVNIRMIIYYYNGDTMLGYRDFTGSIATIHNNDINGNIANRWQLYLLFYNVSVNQECRFNLMVNTGTTALPFETFNAIVAPKNQEQVIDYPYPQILLGDGDYSISLHGYDYGYIYVRLMAKNIYTTQFYTKVETDSRIDQKANEINLGVNQTLTNYSTTNQMNSAITIKANEINSTVSQKVGKNEVISSINQSAESVSINANKVNLAGKTINLTGDNIKIASTNFNVDKNGNVTANSLTSNNATITGGKLNVTGGTKNNPKLSVTDGSYSSKILPQNIYVTGSDASVNVNHTSNSSSHAYLYADSTGGGITLGGRASNDITLRAGSSTKITCYGDMYANAYNYNSKEELKKNIDKFDENVIDIILNSDLYKFNYKNENEKDKKHIGFIIGNGYRTPKEVIAQGGESIDSYSLSSILWRAIQEQQEQIEQMKKEIEKLKGGK